jgi:predicted O-methyltransferase YrrM
MNASLSPARILETATAFWPSKVLLSAIELGVFTSLAIEVKTNEQLARSIGIDAGRAADFFDALVALGFLEREGEGALALYANTPQTDLFLDRGKPTYVGGMPEMLNARLYGIWNHLTEALKTGQAQNETKAGGASIFEALYANEAGLEGFLSAMASIQAGNFSRLAEQFSWSKVQSVVDAGGASGALCVALASRHPHLKLTSFDLPPVAPIASRTVKRAGLADRIAITSGDFFVDPLPPADVVVMGNVLHDWGEPEKLVLIEKAYAALPSGGALIVVENIIDDKRRSNAFGLMMSLNMLLETGADGGFDFTGAQFDGWCKKVGFVTTELMPLVGPASAAIAFK